VIRKHINPFDESVSLGALTLSPSARRLGLRVGRGGVLACPALCDPETERITPLVPDDAARAAWLAAIVKTARGIVAKELDARGGTKVPKVARSVLLPMPSELAECPQPALRLRRLARIARAVCDRPSDAAPPPVGMSALLDEARLFSDYLSGDYSAALVDLSKLEDRADGSDAARRLLGLRAQIELAAGERETARATLGYVQRSRVSPSHVVEETPSRPVLSAVPDPLESWLTMLSAEVDKRPGPKTGEPPTPHLGPSDPDFPQIPNGIELLLPPRTGPTPRVGPG
jgi:hypothetical protein